MSNTPAISLAVSVDTHLEGFEDVAQFVEIPAQEAQDVAQFVEIPAQKAQDVAQFVEIPAHSEGIKPNFLLEQV